MGYLGTDGLKKDRNENDIVTQCIPFSECKTNEVFKRCKGCDQNCGQTGPLFCPLKCIPGCRCKNGYSRDFSGKCIPTNECSGDGPISCGNDEVFKVCKGCDSTCDNWGRPKRCLLSCFPGCACKTGYVRHMNKCITPKQCPRKPFCSKYEEFKTCKGCEQRCGQKGPAVCKKNCEAGCTCKKGYSRNEKERCIPTRSCPFKSTCGKNQVFKTCGSGCGDPKCGDKPGPKICPAVCFKGCMCRPGYVRNDKNECVSIKQCVKQPLKPVCGKNQVFKTCGSGCGDPKCGDKPGPKICPVVCFKGCMCRPGYVRNDKNECVSIKQCVKQPLKPVCGKNQVFKTCGSGCGDPKCGDKPGPKICPAVCFKGCMCRPGYVRNDKKECVQPRQCEKEPSCNVNEEYDRCGSLCGDYKCSDIIITDRFVRICRQGCKSGCFCKKGYARDDHNDKCVAKRDCFNSITYVEDKEDDSEVSP